MKICMVSTMYLRSKDDTRGLMVYELNRNLTKKDVRVEIVAPADVATKKNEVMDNVTIHRFTYFFPKNLQKLAYGAGIPTNIRKSLLAKLQIPFFAFSFLLKTITISRRCDLVHAQWTESGLIGLIAKKFTKKKVIVTVRRVSGKGILGMISNYVLTNADHVLFNSNYTRKESLKRATPTSYSVIHNSIDTNKFKPVSVHNIKKKLNIVDKKVIFSMGLLVEKKGFNYLIKAMKTVIKQHPNTVLLLAGHGPEEKKLRKLARGLGIKDHVLFLGTITADKTPLYHNCTDIFVLPSIIDSKGETETLGVVLLEAMACEKPVIASDVGGIPDIVDSTTGILVQPKDAEELSNQIITLLRNSNRRQKLGRSGRKKIVKNFSSKDKVKKTIAVYQGVLKTKN